MNNLVTATERNPGPRAAGRKQPSSSGSINASAGVTVALIPVAPDYFLANLISVQLLGQEDSVDFSSS